MKKKLLIFLLLAVSGCASITFNPETGEVKYKRIGDQHIQGLIVEKDGNKISVSLEGQASEAEALTTAITVLGGLVDTVK